MKNNSESRHRERRKRNGHRDERLPWYGRSKVWLCIGAGILCALLLYWVLFIAVWDGPNQ